MSNIKINSTPSRVQYAATGGQTQFAIPFPFNTNDDLKVYQRVTGSVANDSADLLTITTDYTITGAGVASGGTLTLVVPAVAGDIITIFGDDPVDRDTIFNDPSRITNTSLNTQFNNLVIYIKQLETRMNELVLSYQNNELTSNQTTLPRLEPDQIWKRNTAGTAFVGASIPDYPVGSLDGDFDFLGRITRTAGANEIEDSGVTLSDANVISTASGDLNLTATGDLRLRGVAWPTSGASAGLVPTLVDGTTLEWAAAGGSGDVDLPTVADAISKFNDTAGTMQSADLFVLDASSGNVDVTTTSNNNIRLLPNGTGQLLAKAVPTAALGVATKSYVDAVNNAVRFEQIVRVATTANLSATYNNGTSGVGATLTNSGVQAAIAIDGVTLSLNDRVLVKNQTNAFENGIYTATTLGDGSSNWVLTRATDYDSADEIQSGDLIPVLEGDTYDSQTSGFLQIDTVTTVGTDDVTFVQWVFSPNQFVSKVTSTNNAVALFDGTDGTIKNSTFVASGNNLVLPADPTVALAAATKQYVDANAGGSGETMSREITQNSHGFSVGQVLYLNGATYTLANAAVAASAESVGIVSAVADANTFTLTMGGHVTGLSGLTAGAVMFLSTTVAGALTGTAPTTPGVISKPQFVADSTTSGYFINYRGATVGTGSSSASDKVTIGVVQVAHGFAVGDALYLNSGTYTKAIATSAAAAEVVGIVSAVADADNFTLLTHGLITGLSGLTAGSAYFLSPGSAGALTATIPTTSGQVVKPLLIANSTTSGYFINLRGELLGTPGGSGSAARFWVRYVSTTIASSYNVTSITNNATGDVTINLTAAMGDANYAVVASTQMASTSAWTVANIFTGPNASPYQFAPTTTTCRIGSNITGVGASDQLTCVAGFGN